MAEAKKFNEPVSAFDMPRCGGIASFFRLPIHKCSDGLDACIVGVPFDNGTSNRTGARYGPRSIRTESVLVRTCNNDTGAAPYQSMNVADIGDIYFNPFDIKQACKDIQSAFRGIIENGCKTIAVGGDHTITYPILQAFKDKYGPIGLIHLDAHADTNDNYNGFPITHGTPFRRAVEERLLDTSRVVQIGLRGSGYGANDWKWGINKGFKVYPARQCWYKSMGPIMAEVRQIMGDKPVYLSFDIDVLDPSCAPGTGTPEIAGLTTIQAVEVIRALKGLNIVGCDLVEVSPPYDSNGMTAITAANLLFEMLCVLPEVKYLNTAFDADTTTQDAADGTAAAGQTTTTTE